MGPLYRTKRIQDTIHQNSSFVICSDQNESILLPVSQRRDRKSSQQTGSGKGTESGNSRLLFPDIPCAKKERKVSFNIRPVFIKPLHRETSIQNGDSQIGKTSDETQRLGCLHRFNRCISTCADTSSIQEVSSFRTRRSSISLFGPTVRNVPKSVNFLETDGRYRSFSTPTCHISFSIPRRLADKKSDSQPSDYSDKDLHSNYSKPRFSAKSQEVRPLSCSEIHLHRYGISDATKFSQGSSGSCTEPNSNNQENNVSKTCIGTNFPFSFGQTQCCSRPCSPGQTALTSSSDVPAVSLETSYSSSRSPDLDKRHDSISLTMVDKPHSIRDRDFNPSSRPQILPLYGCQSLRMGSSFRADNTVLSWSLDRKPIPAPYQYVRNDGHTISTETSQNIYSPFLHHDIHRQHNGGLIYQQTGWHSFPQSLRRSLENTQLVPGTRHSYQSTSHPRQIQHSCRPPLKTRQTYQDRMGSGSNSCEFSIPDAQLPKRGSVCDKIQPQTPIICLSSTRLQSTSDRCPVHGLESSSCICFSSFYSDTCCSRENPTTSVQNSSHSSVLATATVVLRTSSSISVSSDSSATNSKTTDSIQRKICTSKPPNSRPSRLGVIKQSIRDKKFSQNVADFVSRSRRASTQKVYDAKWTIFSNWCHTKKVNPISAPITVIADFLIFLFSEKKCQISTIKGYRSMISNTLKFKTGNRIGSNPVLSELIRSFELQRPVQRSLTPKWDLSWVLVCLQKPPFEPLDKASKFHATIKTAFLLALATAKRCSEIHALAMDSQHLRFNQSDGSVSLILKSGFLAKNQLPSVKPDPIVVPSLARICKWEHTDRLLCPVRALKFYLKMTSSYRQNRTRLFLPIKGNKDISKDTISRWISYTVKLAYRKLTKRDISFLKIKAHEVRALSSSWAFFDKVPLNDILQAAVWNSSLTFAKFYLRDMSQQAQNLQSLGPIVVAQKVVGGQQQSAMDV